jgi:predicted permease
VLGTPVLLGRDFTDADSAAAPKVAIIDETFAKRYLANREPVGHRITMSGGRGSEYTIIGVVANSKYTGVRDNGKPTAYIPYTQVRGVSAMHFDLRTSGNPATLLLEVRRAVRELAPDLPLLEPMTQQEQFESSFALGRLVARLSVFFAMLAALLVATGLYGTLAYTVSRRTTEVGVRMALGAQRGEVLWMILRQSLGVSLVGLAIGIPLSIAGTRLVSSMLYGVTPGDPLTFLAAFAGITVVAIAASLIPARRAASVDPIMALRYE